MAKKQYTPEEYKAKLEKKAEKNKRFSSTFLKFLAFCLAIVMVFCAASIAFTRTGVLSLGIAGSVSTGNQTPSGGESVDNNNSTDLGDTNTQTPPQADDNADSNNTVNDNSDNTSNDNAGGDTTADDDASSGNNGAEKPSANASKQEILDMYKKAVANARTKSSSVIRVKDGAINYKGIVEAGALSSIASMLMGMFMAADENAIQVKNENWQKEDIPDATALTLNGIKEITREDKGDTYVITVVAKDATNPKEGADGVGAISGVIEDSQITGAIGSVPLLELNNINIAYENVTVVATVDKATGNLVELKLNAPCVLGLDAKLPLVGSINGAKVGIQVITEYKFSY